MSDNAIITAIGSFIKVKRLEQNRSQNNVAESAGINRSTLSQIENGEAFSLASLIQVLRALDQLELLKIFEIQQELSPLELAKLATRKKQRASGKNNPPKTNSEW